MMTPRSTLTRRVLAALDATPSRIPVVLGGGGSGRTTLVHQLRDRIGRGATQYIDVERIATTPERFFHAGGAHAPFPVTGQSPGTATARRRSGRIARSEEHTAELQSREKLVCRLLPEKK